MTATAVPTNHVETSVEEHDRYLAESARRAAEVDQAMTALLNEGFGDALAGALTVLLDPSIQNYSMERRKANIEGTVLRMVATRDLDRAAASQG